MGRCLEHLRAVVATHARWAGIERSDLVADDFFDGPESAPWDFERPTGRRNMLRERHEDLATDIYREALKESTTAVYDILRVIAEHDGANYDTLVERTGSRDRRCGTTSADSPKPGSSLARESGDGVFRLSGRPRASPRDPSRSPSHRVQIS